MCASSRILPIVLGACLLAAVLLPGLASAARPADPGDTGKRCDPDHGKGKGRGNECPPTPPPPPPPPPEPCDPQAYECCPVYVLGADGTMVLVYDPCDPCPVEPLSVGATVVNGTDEPERIACPM
ncbi:MAG TPA: hypothetical protein VGB42_05485 [Candidatus Thermoplasmatota archaeon]